MLRFARKAVGHESASLLINRSFLLQSRVTFAAMSEGKASESITLPALPYGACVRALHGRMVWCIGFCVCDRSARCARRDVTRALRTAHSAGGSLVCCLLRTQARTNSCCLNVDDFMRHEFIHAWKPRPPRLLLQECRCVCAVCGGLRG